LLLLRSRRRLAWDLPKGKLEPGETPREGALRETLEETGLTPRLRDGFERQVAVLKPAKPTRPAYVMRLTFFLGEVDADAAVTLSHEHDAFRWAQAAGAADFLDRPPLAQLVSEAVGLL
jgi:8-oxo-dGTP pyrophosphatase MutT (NUDIX family)